MPTLKHHLLIAYVPKILVTPISELCMKDKNDEFEHVRWSRGVAKIPISITPDELAVMNFVDGGEEATLLQIQDTFSMYSAISFAGGKKKNGAKCG